MTGTADPAPGGLAVRPDLLARGVSVNLGGRRVLDGVDLRAHRGRVLAVTGPSGAGKSTLLAVLAGHLVPHSGDVRWLGEPVRAADSRPGRQLGVVLQGYGLLPLLTAHENVQLPLQLAGRTRAEVVERAVRALEQAGLGAEQLPQDRLAEELSGGQLQRVALARALVVDPALLIADEPTSELDATTRDVVLDALRSLADGGTAVVLATHDPEVAEFADDVLPLLDGHVVGTA